MSDLLTRFAQRALGISLPTVKPVIAPLFAQGPALADSSLTESVVSASESTQTTTLKERNEPYQSDETSTIPRLTRGSDSAAEAIELWISEKKTGEKVAATGESEFAEPLPSHQKTSPSPSPTPLASLAVEARQVQTIRQAAESLPRGTRFQSVPPVRPALTSDPRTETTSSAASNNRRALPLETLHERNTINVTIGRVDVRAVLSGPQPVRAVQPARAHQAITLGQYLRLRDGGQR